MAVLKALDMIGETPTVHKRVDACIKCSGPFHYAARQFTDICGECLKTLQIGWVRTWNKHFHLIETGMHKVELYASLGARDRGDPPVLVDVSTWAIEKKQKSEKNLKLVK